jgi:hypothetical protein
VESPIPIDRLFELYKIAVDEYRFEVKLGWDRAMYYLIFNSALVSVATGLLKLENTPAIYIFISGIYLVGFGTSLMGVQAIRKGHEYYRRTVVKKTLIEDLLGLTIPQQGYSGLTLAIGTTAGHGDCFKILHDTELWVGRPLRRSSVMFWITGILTLLAVINIAGAGVAGHMFFRPPTKPHEESPTRIIPVVMVPAR